MAEDRFIGSKELSKIVPFSRQHIHQLEKAGQFPKRRKIGKRRVAWLLSEIQGWMDEKSMEVRT